MTVKVGDKVRIVREKEDLTVGKEYVVESIFTHSREVEIIDDVGDYNCIRSRYYEPITPTTISAQLRARMEEHMSNGEYVRAVKWAQLAEQAEALENE